MAKSSRRKSTSIKSSSRKSPTSNKARMVKRRKSTSMMKKAAYLNPISPERQVDILGIVMILIGLLTLMSIFSAQSGEVTSWWVNLLSQGFGWGSILLPILLILLGLWTLLRKISKFPKVTGERITGFVLGFLNLLGWFQLIKPAAGGLIGKLIIHYFQTWFGNPGTIIALSAWLLTSLILLLDLSMADVSKWLGDKAKTTNLALQTRLKEQKQRSLQAKEAEEAGFTPIDGKNRNLPGSTQSSTLSQERKTGPVPEPGMPLVSTINPVKKHRWLLPNPAQILTQVPKAVVNEEVDKHRARVIEETLRSFSAPAHVVEIRRGPAITMFGVKPDYIETRNGHTLVRVSNIVRLQDDIALALQATQIRIQAPVPGKDFIGIELPNGDIDPVSLLEVLQSPSFSNLRGALKFGLGKDVSGTPVSADLTHMPHLLIAGATNSGKSVCINAILAGFLMTLTPDQLRIIMVDPKRVELTNYNGIPHLLVPVIVEPDRVVGALQWLMREMDQRYRKFSQMGVRNIIEYNLRQSNQGLDTLPYLLLVIDEMADLMMLAPDETEKAITRLAQLARATGIHLILATQRPSTDILTGLIKANFPARIAFAVASNVDSRGILDQPGAERLLGRGDMLFQAPDSPAPVRLQGTYVSDREINDLVHFWHQQAVMNQSTASSEMPVIMTESPSTPLIQDKLWKEMEQDQDEDPLTKQAIEIIQQEGRASISLLQKKLRIGYTRSARLIETLEQKGIIGPMDLQTQTRPVLDMDKSNSIPDPRS